MKKPVYLFVMVMLMSGCASFYCSRYPNNNYPATYAENIPIYNNYPPTPYEAIGEVGSAGAPASRWDSIGRKMREYAAAIGGDAIVIQSQDAPYVGTYTTPGYSTTTSNAYGSAQVYGNSIYGSAQGTSHTTYYPGQSIPMYGKSVKGVVIKFKKESEPEISKKESEPEISKKESEPEIMMQDEKYGNILQSNCVYINLNQGLTKRAQINVDKVASSYRKAQNYTAILKNREAVYNREIENGKGRKGFDDLVRQKQADLRKEYIEKKIEIAKDIKKACEEYGNKNNYRIIVDAATMPNYNEEDASDAIIGILNSQ